MSSALVPCCYNLLFLSDANAARSILAEALLRHAASPHFRAFSAGLQPGGSLHPLALGQLERAGLGACDLRSKSYTEYTRAGAPPIHLTVLLAGSAAGETPAALDPAFGAPALVVAPASAVAVWHMPDPTLAADPERAFCEVFFGLQARIRLFLAMPLETHRRSGLFRQAEPSRRHIQAA